MCPPASIHSLVGNIQTSLRSFIIISRLSRRQAARHTFSSPEMRSRDISREEFIVSGDEDWLSEQQGLDTSQSLINVQDIRRALVYFIVHLFGTIFLATVYFNYVLIKVEFLSFYNQLYSLLQAILCTYLLGCYIVDPLAFGQIAALGKIYWTLFCA
jgi:hypothetical protein